MDSNTTLPGHSPDVSSHSLVVYFFVATLCSLLIRHVLASSSKLSAVTDGKSQPQLPPLVPHIIPWLGSLPWEFAMKPLDYLLTNPMFWKQHPVRLRTFFRDIYIIQGAHDQYTFMKTPSLSAFFVSRTFLVNVFCLPHSAAKTYLKDDSGEHAKPRAGSQVPNRNRIQFYTRTSQQRAFIGAGSASTFRRLHCSVRQRVGSIEVAEHWTHIPDFTNFFKFHVTAAAVDAMVGPYLMQHYPSLADDLWSIEENFGSFISRLPRFVNPEAHRLRERALNSIRQWHVWARENFTPASVDEDGNDPYWGTAFFRDRQKSLSNMDGFTHEALASADLSFLWGANSNAILATFWLCLEAYRDPANLQTIRDEVNGCMKPGPDGKRCLDVKALLAQPFLSAMYTENLRMRVHGFLLRQTQYEDVRLNDWLIPRGSFCISASTPTLMEPDYWYKERSGSEHPAEEFWPGRFLSRDPETNELKFSLSGAEPHWTPFGAGTHSCPGRIFTKHENLTSLACMVTMFDCEVLVPRENVIANPKSLPLGVMPPSAKVPVRMRRRAFEDFDILEKDTK